MPENNTQRWPAVDVLELVANLIATYSHIFEIYNENEVYIKWLQETWWEEFETRLWEMELLEEMIADAYRLRKTAMNVLKDLSPNYNHKRWCVSKHLIGAYQYACELWDTDRDNEVYQQLVLDTTQLMYKALSQFMWVELATCWRCLSDSIEDKMNI